MFDCLFELGNELLDVFYYCIIATVPLFIVAFPVGFLIAFVKRFKTSSQEGVEDEC